MTALAVNNFRAEMFFTKFSWCFSLTLGCQLKQELETIKSQRELGSHLTVFDCRKAQMIRVNLSWFWLWLVYRLARVFWTNHSLNSKHTQYNNGILLMLDWKLLSVTNPSFNYYPLGCWGHLQLLFVRAAQTGSFPGSSSGTWAIGALPTHNRTWYEMGEPHS